MVEDFTLFAIGLAWLAIFGMLAGGAVSALVRLARGPQTAPFFARLKRHGITLVQAEEQAGFWGVGRMATRCATCAARDACRRELRWGWLPFARAQCPNAAFFALFNGGPRP